jgi:CRISPR-associated protein Csb1
VTQFDAWLSAEGPAALVLREYLMPVEGRDGVFFPATFAASEDGTFKGGYNIDEFPDGTNVCLVDSVGSQANRIEPLFASPALRGLVPQVVIVAGERRVNLLEAGHRAADALVRCSSLQNELRDAFITVRAGNAEPLARVAPTSIVFGAWDSRDTQAKLPRLLAATIRAFNVRRLTRSAQFVPALDYVGEGLIDEPADKKAEKALAERGFAHVPSSGAHGGVIAHGDIRREATLHLAALRTLGASTDERRPLLQRYILGLALVAFTQQPGTYLRQGCNLVLDPDRVREMSAVFGNGRRESVSITPEEAAAFARAAAAAFGLDPDREIGRPGGPDREVPFDRDLAKADVGGEGGDGTAKRARKRGR